MRVGELHHVVVSVRDMERSLAFYRDGLGLRQTLVSEVRGREVQDLLGLPEGMTGRTVYLQGPSRIGQIELIEWQPQVSDPTPAKRLEEPGIAVLSFPVAAEELAPMHAHLTSMGYPPRTEPHHAIVPGYGPIGAFLVPDPDGNLVELVSLPTEAQIREHRASGAAR